MILFILMTVLAVVNMIIAARYCWRAHKREQREWWTGVDLEYASMCNNARKDGFIQ